MKDQLFILAAPFPDGGFEWYCNDCATLEAALMVNPHWKDKIDVRRVAFPRPREEVVDLVGPDWQGLPMLVMDKDRAPGDAIIVDGTSGSIYVRPSNEIESAYAERVRLRARRSARSRCCWCSRTRRRCTSARARSPNARRSSNWRGW